MMKKAFDCSAVYLFGSYVYGVPNEHSDFDFFVIYNDSSLRSKDVCIGLRQILAPVKKERPVDIVACSKESFERNPDSSIIKRTVIQKGLLLYDGSKNFS
jgi:predicted nucleotidyltransferase